jgi:hypothetical protein
MHSAQSLSPKSITSDNEFRGNNKALSSHKPDYNADDDSYSYQSSTLRTNIVETDQEKEREEYIRNCSSVGIEPTLEFLLVLCDSNATSCTLSKRKKPLVLCCHNVNN